MRSTVARMASSGEVMSSDVKSIVTLFSITCQYSLHAQNGSRKVSHGCKIRRGAAPSLCRCTFAGGRTFAHPELSHERSQSKRWWLHCDWWRTARRTGDSHLQLLAPPSQQLVLLLSGATSADHSWLCIVNCCIIFLQRSQIHIHDTKNAS